MFNVVQLRILFVDPFSLTCKSTYFVTTLSDCLSIDRSSIYLSVQSHVDLDTHSLAHLTDHLHLAWSCQFAIMSKLYTLDKKHSRHLYGNTMDLSLSPLTLLE